MRPMRIAQIGRERFLDAQFSSVELPHLDLCKPQQSLKPPIVTVMGFEVFSQSEVLSLALRAAAESDQAQHSKTGLRDQNIAGIIVQLGARGGVTIWSPCPAFGHPPTLAGPARVPPVPHERRSA